MNLFSWPKRCLPSEDAGQSPVVDAAVIIDGKGESLHIEKEPVRLKEPKQILGLDSLQEIRLSKTLEFERHSVLRCGAGFVYGQEQSKRKWPLLVAMDGF